MSDWLYERGFNLLTPCETSDLLVFSDIRWNFIFQRPQHLMTRFVKYRRVFFFEKPIFGLTLSSQLHVRKMECGMTVVTPYLAEQNELSTQEIRQLIDELTVEENLIDFTLWYYTPEALSYSSHLKPRMTIYDCMAELNKNTDQHAEQDLLNKSDLVLTNSRTLYKLKRHSHYNVHFCPSSLDPQHFGLARRVLPDPIDQARIEGVRIGYFGILDDRVDYELIAEIARQKPEWNIILIGPIDTTAPVDLPQQENIFYLGKKEYDELPAYLANWDCAILPYQINENTEILNPLRILECLSAAKPVVSTSLPDVEEAFGESNLVEIAQNSNQFIERIEAAMATEDRDHWLKRVDQHLKNLSWEKTWHKISNLEAALSPTKAHHSVSVSL